MRRRHIHTLVYVVLECSIVFLSCKSNKETSSASNTATIAVPPVTAPAPKVTDEVAEGLNLGNKAPDIELNDPNGKQVKLSSLKGNVVLIDFWASWCGPCRHENPAVVAAAIKFANANFRNGKGFKVYSVSLDNNKEAWIKAIQKDSLFWPTHVSDLGGWYNVAAVKYNVNTIPTNVLINGDGIIIGKALRGEDLLNALSKYSD